MAGGSDRWSGEIIAISVAIAVMLMLDWLLPGDSAFSVLLSPDKISYLVIGLVILALLLVIGRAETRRRAFTLFVGGGKKRLNSIMPWLKLLRYSPENREHQVLIENKHIIHANVNYTTRAEITYRYWGVVKEGMTIGEKIMPLISKFTDPLSLRKDIIIFRSGDGEQKTSDNQMPIGWNRYNKDVVKLLNEFMRLTTNTYLAAKFRLKPLAKFKSDAIKFELLEARAREIAREMNESYEKYNVRTKAYKAHHILRAFKGVILTMSNPTGDALQNPQIFAKPGAKFDASEMGGEITAGKEYIGGLEVPTHQVNQYGEFIEDINNQIDSFGNLPPPYKASLTASEYKEPRRLKNIKDIIEYPHFLVLMKNIDIDWRNLAWDIRYGFYHKRSRTALDYIDGLKKNYYPEWRDENIKKEYEVSFSNQALDLRALANPGLNIYWGRKKHSDEEPPDSNPFPAISSLGLKRFLRVRIVTDIKNKGLAQHAMSKIPADTGAFEKVVEKIAGKRVVTKPIGGMLSDEEQKAA